MDGDTSIRPKTAKTHQVIVDAIEQVALELTGQQPGSELGDFAREKAPQQLVAAAAPLTDLTALMALIRDHVMTSFRFERDDLDYAPFDAQGGLGKMHQLSGDSMDALIEELNGELVA